MKRKILPLFLACILLFGMITAVSATSVNAYIHDEADILTDQEESALERQLQSISEEYQVQVVVVTASSSMGIDPDTYVEVLYDRRAYGFGQTRDGVLLMICMDPREYRILSNGLGADAISVSDIQSISDAIVPSLRSGDYARAIGIYAEKCDSLLKDHLVFDPVSNLGIALVIGLVVGLIVALSLKGQLKSVHKQYRADGYVRQGSMGLTVCKDLYLYRNVTRTPRQTNNSSGHRSGGSRNVGGGSF